MTQKAGLAYPENPLSAMRELQELSPITPEPAKKPKALHPSKSSSEVASATSSVSANVADESEGTARHAKRGSRQKATDSDEQKSPLNEALIQLLAKPLDSEAKSGPFTSTTVKIQTELWERLGYASTLTDLPKQEILAEALRDYFRKMVKGQ
jgi:hypothetical protein